MPRQLFASLFAVAFLSAAAQAQGPIQRAGQNIRQGIESAVARGEITAHERELLGRVSQRLTFDKKLVNATVQVTVRADGSVVLKGSVADEAAKNRAVDLAESTLGVTAVVVELAVVKDVQVIQAAPAQVILAPPVETRIIVPPARVLVPTEVLVPAETKVIVKP